MREKVDMVRRFFEEDDHLKLGAQMCEPDMQGAIKEYLGERLLHKGNLQAFDTLNITRLQDCPKIEHSEVLRNILNLALDRWAELSFEPGSNPLCATMQEYVRLLSRDVEGPVHAWELTNPTTLRQSVLWRHLRLLRHYLNGHADRPEMAALWRANFPKLFELDDKRWYLAPVFLYGMLEETLAMPDMEPLEEEAEALLVRCGYEYLIRCKDADRETQKPMGFSIFSNVMERSMKKHFYQRKDHEDAFYAALPAYLTTCLHREFISILAGDGPLRNIICLLYEEQFDPKHPRPYPTKRRLRDLERLAHAIPAEYMPAPRWEMILDQINEMWRFLDDL